MKGRRVHLGGETMTACGKIIMGDIRYRRSFAWTPPKWRCPKCERWAAAIRVAKPIELDETGDLFDAQHW
jgi:hypothetical protein